MVNQYLTDDVIANFTTTGSDKLLDILSKEQPLKYDQDLVISTVFTEILIKFFENDNELPIDNLIEFLINSIKDDQTAKLFILLIDSFPQSSKLNELINEISTKQILKPSTLAYLSHETLKDLTNIVPTNYSKSIAISKRDHFYTQKKFNLLHEEFEGFAKLTVEFYGILHSKHTDYQVDYALEVVETLIGHYSLDPNKCLDILFDIFGVNIVFGHKFILNFLKKSRWWPVIEGNAYSLSSLNIGGSLTASKIFGLKLLKSERDLPETYRILIGYLIKSGFVNFGSIWKYIEHTDDEKIKDLEDLYNKRLDDKVNKAGANALALAAPLPDDDEEVSKKPPSVKSAVSEDDQFALLLKQNVKYLFLKVFLSIGAYYPAIFILAKHPFLAYIDDDITLLATRMFDKMIDPLYESIKPFKSEDLIKFKSKKPVLASYHGNKITYETFVPQELLSFNPLIKNHTQKHFNYFYTNWFIDLPQIENVDGLFKYSNQFLKFLGTNLSLDLKLFTKVCEIVLNDLKQNETNEQVKQKWFHYFRNYIFPAMCVIEENSIAIEKAYSILSVYSIEQRFSVYGELHNLLSKKNLRIKIAYNKSEKATKDVLKRLSKENVRPMMRRLAKISFSNPLPCLLTILQQLESYDNLNSLVVETARYFNNYGWDTLTAAILIRLTVTGRATVQANGIFDRQWIQSLTSFIGKICQRYPNAIDLQTILEFLLKSFHGGEQIGLIVLREILSSMGGMQSISNLTLHQINLINCGSTLQKNVYRVISDSRHSRMKSGTILVKTLIDLNAITELLVLLTQIKQGINSSDEIDHLKVLANKNDELDAVINLFVTLITFFGTPDQLEGNVLSIAELCTQYQVPVQTAFDLWRPILSRRTATSLEKLGELKLSLPSILTEKVLENITPELFTTFWYLSLYDINYADDLYDSELKKLNSNTKSLKDALNILNKDSTSARSLVEKAEANLDGNKNSIKQLPKDKESHSEHNQSVLSWLVEESSSWFKSTTETNEEMRYFLQYCVLPRALNSSFDALFGGRFLFKLHDLKTKNFSLIVALDELIKSKILFSTLFTSTTTEAENLGLFFSELLQKLHSWTNETEFDKEACNGILTDAAGDILTYDDFRTTLYGYHETILEDISDALAAEEYMCRRNSITFLKNLVGIYPNVTDQCEKLAKLIENIISTEKREDLKLSSSALKGHLMSRAKSWVNLWDFVPLSDEVREDLIKAKKEKQDEIDRRVAEEKLKKEEEEKKKAEEEKKKVEERKAKELEEKQRKLKSTMNYDSENSSTSQRLDSRNVGSSGRYDNYSKYRKTPEARLEVKTDSRVALNEKNHKVKVTEKNNETTIHDTKNDVEKVKKDEVKSDISEKEDKSPKSTEKKFDVKATINKSIDRKAESSLPVKPSISKATKDSDDRKAADIKSKLLQARKEFAASNRIDPSADNTKGDKSRTRTPLPDQSDVAKASLKPTTAESAPRVSKYNRQSHSNSQADLPPPPPPPPVSQSHKSRHQQSQRGDERYDNAEYRDRYDERDNRDGYRDGYRDSNHRYRSYDKRKNDDYGQNGRHYEKRQRY